jgi:hypothetical protein
MKTEAKKLVETIKRIETMKQEISYFGLVYEFKNVFKKAERLDWKVEDVELLFEMAQVDAFKEAKEDLKMQAKINSEENESN